MTMESAIHKIRNVQLICLVLIGVSQTVASAGSGPEAIEMVEFGTSKPKTVEIIVWSKHDKLLSTIKNATGNTFKTKGGKAQWHVVRDQLDTFVQDVKELEELITKQGVESTKHIAELEGKIRALRKQNQYLRKTHAEHMKKCSEHINRSENKNKRIHSMNRQLKVKVDTLTSKNNKLESKNATLENQNSQLTKSSHTLASNNKEYAAQNHHLKTNNQILGQANERLRNSNARQTREIISLKEAANRPNSLQQENTRLRSINTRLGNENTHLKSRKAALETEIVRCKLTFNFKLEKSQAGGVESLKDQGICPDCFKCGKLPPVHESIAFQHACQRASSKDFLKIQKSVRDSRQNTWNYYKEIVKTCRCKKATGKSEELQRFDVGSRTGNNYGK